MTIAEFFVRMSADTSGLKKGMSEGQAAINAMSRALGQLGIALSAGAFFKKLVDETVASQNAMAQLEARIRSTGGAAGKSVQELDALAQSLQETTTFSDEATKGAEALLLTFKSIKGDNFDRATAATLDLATAMGTDLKTAALQLGKALEDPVRGITALRRSGVSFTEAQRDQIKAMVEAGDVAGAQTLILRELQTEVGGAAAAARGTLGGALAHLSNIWGELFEVSDKSSAGIVSAINSIADVLPGVKTKFDEFLGGVAILGADAAVGLGRLEAGLIRIKRLNPRFLFTDSDDKELAAALKNLEFLKQAADEVKAEIVGMGSDQKGIPLLTQNLEEAEDAAAKLADQVKKLHDGLQKLPTFDDIMGGASGPALRSALEEGRRFLAEAKTRFGTNAAFGNGPGQGTEERSGFTGPDNPQAPHDSRIDGILSGLGDFAKSIGGLLSALNPWKILLDAIGHALGDFLANVGPIVELLADAFMPILKALFPIFKLLAVAATYVGQVFFTIADGVSKALGYLIKGIGKAVDKLPFVSGKGIISAGESLIDLGNGFGEAADELGDARDEIKDLEWKDAADAVTGLGDAAAKTAEMLTNVPEIWNVQLGRFRALQAAAGGSHIVDDRKAFETVAPTSNTFTGDIILPNVRTGQDFFREVEVEATRRSARGGAPIISDSTLRPAV